MALDRRADVGDAPEAARQYESCLAGPFAKDREIRLGAARAFTECQRIDDAMRHLESLREDAADYRPDVVALLGARCLAGAGRPDEARAAYQAAIDKHGTYEAKAEYAIWAHTSGDASTATRLDEELQKIQSRWDAMARHLNEPVMRRYQAAKALARKAG